MVLTQIRGFHGEHMFLSNFADLPAWYDEKWYPTGEHAFQAAKFEDLDYRRRIAKAPTPGEAKKLGRTRSQPLREGWDEGLSFTAMSEVVATKFTATRKVEELLLGTGDAVLVEVTTWHDNRWGSCECGRASCAEPGMNWLGLCLMAVRATLRDL